MPTNAEMKTSSLPYETFLIGRCRYFWTTEDITATCGRVINRYLISDGYSVPPLLWPAIRGLEDVVPALCHDEDYLRQRVSQRTADHDLHDGIIATHLPARESSCIKKAFKAAQIHYTSAKVLAGVRIGGHVAYHRYALLHERYGAEVLYSYHYADNIEDAKLKAYQGLSRRLEA